MALVYHGCSLSVANRLLLAEKQSSSFFTQKSVIYGSEIHGTHSFLQSVCSIDAILKLIIWLVTFLINIANCFALVFDKLRNYAWRLGKLISRTKSFNSKLSLICGFLILFFKKSETIHSSSHAHALTLLIFLPILHDFSGTGIESYRLWGTGPITDGMSGNLTIGLVLAVIPVNFVIQKKNSLRNNPAALNPLQLQISCDEFHLANQSTVLHMNYNNYKEPKTCPDHLVYIKNTYTFLKMNNGL